MNEPEVVSMESEVSKVVAGVPKVTADESNADTIFSGLKSELRNSFRLHCRSRIDEHFNTSTVDPKNPSFWSLLK